MRTKYSKEIKDIKKAMLSSGCDKSVVKTWVKAYEKSMKAKDEIAESYSQAKVNLRKIEENLRQLDNVLSDRREWDPVKERQYINLITMLRVLQDSYKNEFLISDEDSNYQLSYSTTVDLAFKYNDFLHDKRRQDESTILKSEVENLLVLTRQNLVEDSVNMFALSYYAQCKSINNLQGMSVKEKDEQVMNVYKNEFEQPMIEQLVKMYTARGESNPYQSANEFINMVTDYGK